MTWWQIALVLVAVAVLVYVFRRRIVHGRVFARELKPSEFANGHFPDEFYQANSDMQHKVSDAVTRYYAKSPPAGTPSELLPFFGKTYTYIVPLEKLVNEVRFVDQFPDGASANVQRASPGAPTVLTLTPRALQRPSEIEHELAHSLSMDRPELWKQCQRYKGAHWPVMFDVLGPYS